MYLLKRNLPGESPAKECKQLKGFHSFEGPDSRYNDVKF